MLTGARRSSLLQVRRNDVDFERGVIVFRHMKTSDQSMMFPMGTFLRDMLKARLETDAPLNSEWLWPSPTSASGKVEEPKEPRRDLPSPHEYRHLARTMFIAAGVPYAESALLLGQKLPGASGGYVHAGLHACGSLPVLYFGGLSEVGIAGVAAAEFVIHYLIDYVKAVHAHLRPHDVTTRTFWALHGADQFLHHLTYSGMLYFILTGGI